MPDMPAVSPLDMPSVAISPRSRVACSEEPAAGSAARGGAAAAAALAKARHPLVVVLNFFLMVVVLVVRRAAARSISASQRFDAAGPLAETDDSAHPAWLRSRCDRRAARARRRHRQPGAVHRGPCVLRQCRGQLKAGEYLVQASIQHAAGDGRSPVRHARSCTPSRFPEGLTSEQIVDRLNADDTPDRRRREPPPEGSLLPDTYKFKRGATRQQILDRMRGEQTTAGRRRSGARRAPDLPIKTPEELVTLASIVEKETGQGRRAPARRRRLHQPPAARTCGCSPTRPSSTASSAARARSDRPITERRPRQADALQHLHDRRPAAGADRQSGPRRAGGGRQPVAHQGPLFRRRRHRRPRLRGDARRPEPQRRRWRQIQATQKRAESAAGGGRCSRPRAAAAARPPDATAAPDPAPGGGIRARRAEAAPAAPHRNPLRPN